MDILPTHNFVARGEAFQDDEVPVTITGSYPKFTSEPVKCTIIPDTEHLSGKKIFNNQRKTNLRGKTEYGKDIWIPDFHVSESTTSHPRNPQLPNQHIWKGVASFFIEGDLDEFIISDGEIIISLITPPTPIAWSGVSYIPDVDGTINIWDNSQRKGISWSSSIGDAEFIEMFDYHRPEIPDVDQFLARVRRCQITIKGQFTGRVSLKAILENLKDEFDSALLLLSFLSRTRVGWYEAEATFFPPENKIQEFRRAICRRDRWMGYGNSNSQLQLLNVLVELHALKDGLFQQLLTNYEKSEYRDTIRQAIIHLLMSHEPTYLENRYTSAFTAIECLTYGMDKDNRAGNLLNTSQFNKLAKKLRGLIRSETPNQDTDTEGIVKKIPELKRRAFTDRLLMLLNDIDIAPLWPPNVNVEVQLADIVKRRNIYLHQGRVDDTGILIFDLNRLQNLVELWILQILECPKQAVSKIALGHLVAIEKEL